MTYNPLYDNDPLENFNLNKDDKKDDIDLTQYKNNYLYDNDPLENSRKMISGLEEKKKELCEMASREAMWRRGLTNHPGGSVPFAHNPGMAVPPYNPGNGGMGPGFIP